MKKISLSKLGEPFFEILYWFCLTRSILWIAGGLARHYISPINPNFYWWLTPEKWLSVWGSWDSGWYLPLARFGYSSLNSLDPLTLGQNNTVFFPLYPLLIRLLSPVFGFFFSGFVISNLALVLGCFGLYKLICLNYDRNTALRTVKMVLVFPFSFFLSSILTESLFFCLSVWSIYWFKINKTKYSFSVATLLALTRPTGILIALPLSLLAWKDKKYALALQSLLFPALGLLLYMGYLYDLSHNPFIFIETQKAWGRSFSFPPFTIFSAIIHGGYSDKFGGLVATVSISLVYVFRRKLTFEIFWFSLAVLIFPLLSGIASYARYSLASIGLFLISGLASENPKIQESLQIIFISLNVVFFVLWTSGFTFII